MAILIAQNDFPRDIALDNLVREVPPHRVATDGIDLKALLKCKPTGLQPDVHEPRAREVSVGEYWEHVSSVPTRFSVEEGWRLVPTQLSLIFDGQLSRSLKSLKAQRESVAVRPVL